MKKILAYAKNGPVGTLLRQEPILWPMLALLFVVYLIPHTPLSDVLSRKYQGLPDVQIDFHPTNTALNRFSRNRTALYIENNNDVNHVTPLLLHMTQVIPAEWRFVFIGSEELVKRVSRSAPIHRMVDTGKIRLETVERWTDTWRGSPDLQEISSRLLTNITFLDEQFPGVENLLVFRSGAILCANAEQTVNDFLEYDLVGPIWEADDKFRRDGGLSIRRLPRLREVLEFQERLPGSMHEDEWFSNRLGLLPDSNRANVTVSQSFAVRDVWSERPLGYYVRPNIHPDNSKDVWALQERRKQIFEYCPELRLVMNMRLEKERCPDISLDTGLPLDKEKEKSESSKRMVRKKRGL